MVAQSSLTSATKPSAPFPYMSSLEGSFSMGCGVLLLFLSFPGTVVLPMVSDWGRHSCIGAVSREQLLCACMSFRHI